MSPKRTFSRNHARLAAMLAGTIIVLAGFLGTGTAGAARAGGPRPGRTAPPAASAPEAVPRAALTAYGPPGRHPRPGGLERWHPRQHHRHHPHRHHPHRHHRHHPRRHHPHRHHPRRHPARHRPRIHRTPQQIARSLLAGFHWARWQFRYLNLLWMRESGWNRFASNPSSGAYGIPQAVPGAKMASAGPDWRSSARTQIRWGMGYIRARYVTPRRAWQHELSDGWY